MTRARLILMFLFVLCFGLAAQLVPQLENWSGARRQSGSLLTVLLGDSRRMFANHFFIKADVYFHSGYYPSIFDDRMAHQTPHMAEDAGAVEGKNQGEEGDFLGRPRDWIERFGRHFFPAEHTHLDQGGAHDHSKCKGHHHAHDQGGEAAPPAGLEREILPWLRISAELDPHQVETYTVASYWLRNRMGKVTEAEQFLREGLRANPDSYEILFELGRVCFENRKDVGRARNVWEAALRRWDQQETAKPEPNLFLLQQLLAHLAKLEEGAGRFPVALAYWERLKTISPAPAEVQKRIDELRHKPGSPDARVSAVR
jgi:tetratricopeptide (TPR) repeat protein